MERADVGNRLKDGLNLFERRAFSSARIRDGIRSVAAGLNGRYPGPNLRADRCEP